MKAEGKLIISRPTDPPFTSARRKATRRRYDNVDAPSIYGSALSRRLVELGARLTAIMAGLSCITALHVRFIF